MWRGIASSAASAQVRVLAAGSRLGVRVLYELNRRYSTRDIVLHGNTPWNVVEERRRGDPSSGRARSLRKPSIGGVWNVANRMVLPITTGRV